MHNETQDKFEDIEIEYSVVDPEKETTTRLIKCGNNTDPNKLAYFIAREFEEMADHVEIQSIGPKALSKAMLAIVRLQGIVAPYIVGSTLVTRVSVRKLQLPNNEERTAIRIRLFPIPDKFLV